MIIFLSYGEKVAAFFQQRTQGDLGRKNPKVFGIEENEVKTEELRRGTADAIRLEWMRKQPLKRRIRNEDSLIFRGRDTELVLI
jgi:hypothetical protein